MANSSRFLMAALMLATVTGCVMLSVRSIDAHGGYARGASFRTKLPLAVMSVDDGGKRLVLVAMGPRSSRTASRYYGVDMTSRERNCPVTGLCKDNPEGIVAIVPAGIALNVSTIEQRRGYSAWFGKQTYVSVISACTGELADLCRTIDITDLSVLLCCDRDRDRDRSGDSASADPKMGPDPAILEGLALSNPHGP